ncbi:MAG: hypothetical protein IK005_11025 [Paludibacteraceae bacterium]|nr:hypothetical protein [Paludibacteraceae bacterium]MBR4840992.1 hypothetical protein [Paludibacteraceae bacterium]
MKKTISHIALAFGSLFLFQQNSQAAWDGKTETYGWYINADTLAGETIDNPFIIATESDLVGLAKLVCESVANTSPHPNAFDGKYFVLTNDLDFSDKKGKANNWTPIGNKKNPFRGYFLGQGHTIKNLTIKGTCNEKSDLSIDVYSESKNAKHEDIYSKFQDTKCNDLGLFGHIMHAKVCDLKLENITIDGNYIIGGICGHAGWDSSIKNCSVEGELKGNGLIGGICGYMEMRCVIDSCSTHGTIISSNGKLANGGICGLAQTKCDIKNCKNTASIFCNEAEYVGGICGMTNRYGSLTRCTNSGDISVTGSGNGNFSAFGGICGVLGHSCKLEENTNIGHLKITASQGFVGGNCGLASEETTVINNFNAGGITASKEIISGGICGMNYRNTTNNNINVGNIDSEGIKGGVIGYNYKNRSIVTKCYYDKQMCPADYGIGMTEAGSKKGNNHGTDKMETAEMVSVFTKPLDLTKWSSAEGNYPFLTSMSSSEIVKLSAQPIILKDGQNVNNVTAPFKASTTNGTRWSFNAGDITMDENGEATILQSGTVTLTLTDGISKRVVNLTSTK